MTPASLHKDLGANMAAGRWRVCGLLTLFMIAATFWPGGFERWMFDRAAIADGEWWRLLTGHLVHLNAVHLGLNLAGLWLLTELLWRQIPAWQGVALLACAAALIDAGLWFADPRIDWYGGASGMLHGLWAGCALSLCMAKRKQPATLPLPRTTERSFGIGWQTAVGATGVVLLLAKLIAEAWFGASSATVELTGQPVLIEAHRYGAAGGGLGWLAVHGACRLGLHLHHRPDFD